MLTLDELTKIKDRVKLEKEVIEYNDIVSNLDQNLKDAASRGKSSYSVMHTTEIYAYDEALADKMVKHLYLRCAWGQTVSAEDIIKVMKGNLKKVYEYLEENKLNPILRYWTDGDAEGVEIVIKWE